MFDSLATEDFSRAYRRGFWRRMSAWVSGKSNDLLAYDEVRRQLPFLGQRDIGLQEIPVDKIVGSVGRYRDFDRAFLPTQKVTSGRWISVSKARYQDVELPPIEVYKIGDVYFVKDGNHRVSVARERNQLFIDAYVTEIDVPVALTADMEMEDVIALKDYAEFVQATNLKYVLPDADLRLTLNEEYDRLMNHIITHQYFISQNQQEEVSLDNALRSWHENVYRPLVSAIQDHNLPEAFPGLTMTDLYLVVSEYQWLLREQYQGKASLADTVQQLQGVYSEAVVRRTLHTLERMNWIEEMILAQERRAFFEQTKLDQQRPDADIALSLPGKYENLLRHISAHQYYMGEAAGTDVPFEEASASFYDNVYVPLLALVHEQNIIADFPARTEADLCLWMLDHRQDLVAALDTLPGKGGE